MPDWKDAAAVRGVTLTDAQAARLEAIDRSMTLMSAMIDWKEEPVQVFKVDEIAANGEGNAQ